MLKNVKNAASGRSHMRAFVSLSSPESYHYLMFIIFHVECQKD